MPLSCGKGEEMEKEMHGGIHIVNPGDYPPKTTIEEEAAKQNQGSTRRMRCECQWGRRSAGDCEGAAGSAVTEDDGYRMQELKRNGLLLVLALQKAERRFSSRAEMNHPRHWVDEQMLILKSGALRATVSRMITWLRRNE
jgi:hypothetical protein